MSRFTESKWLPIVVAAGVGLGVMLLLGYAFSDTLLDADTIGEVLGIIFGMAAASYFVTGLIAGVWTRQTRSGINAALVLVVVNIIYSFARGSVEANLVAILIAVVFAIGAGSLGGFVGKRIRR